MSASAQRQRTLESRLEDIAAEIERLRREREAAIQNFRAFTGRPRGGAADAGRESQDGTTRAGQPAVAPGDRATLETYAAELADRGPRRTANAFSRFEAHDVEPRTERAFHPVPRGRSRKVLRIVVPVLALVAVATAVSMLMSRWAPGEPAGETPQAPPSATGAGPAPPSGPATVATAGADRVLPPAVGTSGRQPAPALTLELTTVRDVWIRTSVDDQPAASRVLPAGATLTVEAERHVELRLGDAGAVTARLNGEDQGPLGRDGEVLTRRFETERDRPEP